MKNHHKKLVFADRISIQNLLKARQSVPKIAAILGVNKTTIYRELERCNGQICFYRSSSQSG